MNITPIMKSESTKQGEIMKTIRAIIACSLILILLLTPCNGVHEQEINVTMPKTSRFDGNVANESSIPDVELDLCDKSNVITTDSSAGIEFSVVAESTHFIVRELVVDDLFEYEYTIFNNDSEIVDSKKTSSFPYLSWLDSGSVLVIRLYAGTNTSSSRYYNIKGDCFSEWFYSVALENDDVIVYMTHEDNQTKLVIRDIFDKNSLYLEYDLGFSPVANPADALISAEFVNCDILRAKYLSGEGYEEKTTTICFRKDGRKNGETESSVLSE